MEMNVIATPNTGMVDRLVDRRSHLIHNIGIAKRIHDKMYVGDEPLKDDVSCESIPPATSLDGVVYELQYLCNELEVILNNIDKGL